MVPFNITEPPLQNDVGPAGVIVATGKGSTVILFETALEQPPAFVTV